MTCPFGFKRAPETSNTAPKKRASAAYRRAATLSMHLANNMQPLDDSQEFDEFSPSESGRAPINLPGPRDEEFVEYNSKQHHYLTELHKAYGDSITIIRDGMPVVFVRGRKEVKAVLQSEDFGKTWDSEAASGGTAVDYVMNLIQPMLKNTIFNKHGDENMARRAMLRPLFTGPQHFLPQLTDSITEEIGLWGQGVVDIQDLSHNLLRKNILVAMCGDYATQAHSCLEAFHEVMEYFVQRYKAACHDQSVNAEDDRMMHLIYDASLRVVQDFRALVEAHGATSEATSRSMLNLYMKAGYSDAEMAATIVNVMIAAGEAPASALAQTLEELARNPAVQEKLLAEAQGICASSGSLLEGYSGLEYTEQCMVEGLRLFAPATLVQRSAMRDTMISGAHVPKGTVVGICVHSVHANEAEFPCAQEFNPDRDTDFELSPAFVTFSKGQRGCPGKHVALAICKLSLAMIVKQFELTVAPNQPPSAQCAKVAKMVEWSVNGIPVALRRR